MQPLQHPKSLMEVTAEKIRDAIVSGELPLGSKLSEQRKLRLHNSFSSLPWPKKTPLIQRHQTMSKAIWRDSSAFRPADQSTS